MDDPDEILLDAEDRMDGAVNAFRRELTGIRTGRAHPSLVDSLEVDYYGTSTPIKQLGTIGTPEPRMITIQVWDQGAVRAVEKAIQSSNLGLNPAVDGQLIRLPIPPLSEDRRKDLVKLVHQKTEDGRVAVRNVRRSAHDALRKIAKESKISEDDLHRKEDELQSLTDKHIALIEEEASQKETELLEV